MSTFKTRDTLSLDMCSMKKDSFPRSSEKFIVSVIKNESAFFAICLFRLTGE